jgi:hypothetical protein
MKDIARSLAAAAELYSVELNEMQMAGYLLALKGKHQDDVIAALSIAVKECKFFPKVADILTRIPTKPANTFLDEAPLSDAERALNQDLGPLLFSYLNGAVNHQEWYDQMQYFADKHGLGDQMRESIRKNKGGV